MERKRKEAVGGVTDPIVMFLAGAFVGIALGPRLLRAVGGAIGSKASQVVESWTDRFVERQTENTISGEPSGQRERAERKAA